MKDERVEQAISLKDAARLLNISYSTIFQHREQIGVQLPGGRKWIVYPSRLAELAQPRYNVTRLSQRVDGVKECQSAKMKKPESGTSTSARQAVKELDALLAQRTGKQRRSTTTV